MHLLAKDIYPLIKKFKFFKEARCLGKISPNAFPYEKIKVWEQEGSGYIEFDANEARLNPLGHIVSEGNIQKNLLESLEKKKYHFIGIINSKKLIEMMKKLPAKQVIMN